MATETDVQGIVIDRRKCIACGACTAVCPTQALIVEGLALVPVPERCRPCGQAAIVCPTGALTCPGGRDQSESRHHV